MTRPRHELALWHTSYSSNGTAISSNYVPTADGLGNVAWSPNTSIAHSSNTYAGLVTLTTPGDTVAITRPDAGTLAIAAPLFAEPVTDSGELVWYGEDIVMELVRY